VKDALRHLGYRPAYFKAAVAVAAAARSRAMHVALVAGARSSARHR